MDEKSKYTEEIELLITSNVKEVTDQVKDLTEKTVIYRGAIGDVKKEQEELNIALHRGDITMADFSAKTAVLDKTLSDLQAELKKTEADIKLLNKASLQDIWNGLVDGVKHARSLKDAFGVVSTAFSAFTKILKANPFKEIKTAFQEFTKTLMANPFVAIGTIVGVVLVGAFKKLKEAFERNSEAGAGLKRLFEMLQTPMRIINKIFDKLAQAIGVAANKIADFIKKFAKFLGIEVTESTKAMKDLNAAEREFTEESAKRQAEINKKRAEAERFRRIDAKKSEELVREAMELEKEQYEAEVNIINQRIAAEKERQKAQVDNSTKAKKTLAKLQADLSKAESKYQNHLRALNRSENQLESRIEQRTRATQSAADAAAEAAEKEAKAIEDRDNAIQRSNEKNIKSNEKANQEILKTHNETIKAEIDNLEAAAKNLEGKNRDIAMESVNYLKLTSGINAQIEELNTKIFKANKQADDYAEEIESVRKELATEQVQSTKDLLNERLKVLTSGFNSELNLVAAYEEKRKALNKSLQNAEEDHINALTNIDSIYEKKRQEIYDKFNYSRYTSIEDQMNKDLQALEFANELNIKANKDFLNKLDELREQGVISEEFYAQESARIEEKKTLTSEEYERKRDEIQKYYMQERAKRQVQEVSNLLGSFAQLSNTIANAYQAEYEKIVSNKEKLTAEEAEAAVSALESQKAYTIAALALQQAQAIGSSVIIAAQAASVGGPAAPFIFAATLAGVMAGVISTIVNAKKSMDQIDAQISEVRNKVPKYATGGYIQGAGTGTSDSIPARLSNGESVINARSTERFYDLLSAINQAGGGVAFPNAMSVPQLNFATGGVAQSYENTYRMIENAVANIQPVVSVKEITKVQNRLKTKEII